MIGTPTRTIVTAVAAAAWAGIGGCVKHEETITVHPDGSVRLEMVVSGDREDMENGAPAMARAPGWTFAQHLVTEEDDKQEVHRQAEITIPPGQPLPAAYPTDDPEGEALALHHPTTLTIEQRPDGTYYHFRRVYEPRAAAFVNVWWNELYEEYGDNDPGKMDRKAAREFVRKLGDVERRKQIAIVTVAAQQLDHPWPQDLRLAVYDAINNVIGGINVDEVVDLLKREKGEDEPDGSDAELDALGERIDRDVSAAITAVLRGARVPLAEVQAFDALLARERRRFAITDDYIDEAWQITLNLPGTLVGHNGDKVEDGAVVWERKGEHFYDRTVELLATSKVTGRDTR